MTTPEQTLAEMTEASRGFDFLFANQLSEARAVFGGPARALLWALDWIPARLTALSFAIVGDFEDAAFSWRTQAKTWAAQEGGEHAGIVLSSGGGALGVMLGGPLPVAIGEPELRPELGLGEAPDADLLPSAVGLVWRALVLWLLHAPSVGTPPLPGFIAWFVAQAVATSINFVVMRTVIFKD